MLGQPNHTLPLVRKDLAPMAREDAILSNTEELIRNILPNMVTIPDTHTQPFTIFRVPAHIRNYKNNNHYFEPRVVSIGPYHRGKVHLQAMEMHKQRYIYNFLEKSAGRRREEYVEKIYSLIPSIRKCYFESIDDLKDNDLVRVMFLDGCFILQLLIKLYIPLDRCEVILDPVFSVDWNLPLISTDLLMLENQIPFFVLENLYEIYSYPGTSPQSPKPTLDDLLLNFVKQVEHRRQEEVFSNLNQWKNNKRIMSQDYQIHHLLHFYYIAYIPVLGLSNSPKGTEILSEAYSSPSLTSRHQAESCRFEDAEDAHLPNENQPSEGTTCTSQDVRSSGEIHPSQDIHEMEEVYPQEDIHPSENIEYSGDINLMEEGIHQETCQLSTETSPAEQTRYPRMIPCATELHEFGITFKKEEFPKNFLDISFVRGVLRGVLKIPCISIEETTKPKYMNLVAFEQSSGTENKHMTSYVLFIDFLLNTRKDVIVLQRDHIIENKLANEDQVAEFFSQFHGCCYINFDKHHLAPVFRDVKAYCDAFWPKHRAKLYRDYFSNPWAIFSLCAALLVLCITVFRTICFILSVFFHRHLN